MAKESTKKIRFNYVMNEQDWRQLALLQCYAVEVLNKRGSTKGGIIRKLVADEVKRLKI